MSDSWWSFNFTESQRKCKGEGGKKFSLKIRPHMKFQIVAYEMRKKDCKKGNFVLYTMQGINFISDLCWYLNLLGVFFLSHLKTEHWWQKQLVIVGFGLLQYFKIKTPKEFCETAVKLQTLL